MNNYCTTTTIVLDEEITYYINIKI